MYELRHIYADLFYQVFRRAGRLADPFHMYMLPTAVTGFYLLAGQHLFFMVINKHNNTCLLGL